MIFSFKLIDIIKGIEGYDTEVPEIKGMESEVEEILESDEEVIGIEDIERIEEFTKMIDIGDDEVHVISDEENDANRQNALQANNLTQKGLDEIWQKERDLMAYAFATAESAAERRNKLLMNELDAEGASDSAFSSALGTLGGAIINGIFGLFG